MRKKFTILTAALALLAMLAVPTGMWGQTTYKLQQVTSVTAGGLYVFEQEGHVMNNSISSNALQTTSTYNATGLAGTETYVWTLETADGGFYMRNVSLTSSPYLNNTKTKTNMSFGNKDAIWAFNFQNDNTVLIQNIEDNNRFLGYTTATSYAYKAYATSNLSGYAHAVVVYQLVEESNPTITVDSEALSFEYVVGGSADDQTLTISGEDLTEVINGTLTGNGFAISDDNGSTWNKTSFSIDGIGEIKVRLNPGLSLGNYSGQITLTSQGAETVTVTLTGAVTNYPINLNQPTAGGTISADKAYAAAGETVTLTATAATGYEFDEWTVIDGEAEFVEVINNQFTMPASAVEVDASFNQISYTITIASTTNGTVSCDDETAHYGDNIMVEVTPAEGYRVQSFTVAETDGQGTVTDIEVEDEYYSFDMPAFNITITVVFEIIPGTINRPYTVAEAIAAAPGSGSYSDNVYIHGIVSSFYNNSIMGDGTNFRYYISDDGTTTTQLLVYKGKGLNNVAFSNENDLLVGDEVTILGKLTTYQSSPEIYSDNYIVSLVRQYRVTYDGNGATSGTVPTDETVYDDENNTVTVLGNTGNLVKDCNNWGGWNTEEDGSGDTYQANETFTITSHTTLYAIWNARSYSYSLNQTGATEYIDVLELYVPGQDGWEADDPIQCGQQVAVSVILTDEENYYCTITVVDGDNNPIEVSSEMFTMPDSNVTITVTVSQRPQFNIICNPSIGNGTITAPATAFVEETVIVTVTPESGYTLNTLTATYVDDNGDTQSLDFFGNTFVMPAADVTVSAMFSKCVEDVLDRAFTGISSGAGYSDWSDKTGASGAVYKGTSAGGNDAIQLRSSGGSGIITTGSGGKAKRVVVSWESHTADNRVLQIYGKNTAYTSASDLYNNNNKGTLLGYISYNSSTDYTTELIIPGDYEYIGIRSSSNALYLDEIRISWVHSYTEEVAGHGTDNTTGWQFIASPILENVTVSVPDGDDADLYYYDEQYHMWRNYKKAGNESYFTFPNGTGYLYANRADATVTFAGTSVVTASTKAIDLEYHANVSESEPNTLAGWNLVGNPFNCSATLDMDCYTITGTAINTEAHTANDYIVAPCKGVMVKATGENQSVTFSKVTTGQTPQPNQLQLTVAQQVVTRSGMNSLVNDNAIINFNAGSQLEKFVFNADAAKLYIPQNDKEYAIVSSEAQGEMPVNFRVNEDGQYTLTVNPENVDMNYLHLIDNMTGMDVDLLQTSSYTFNATTRDYESRFRLVFAANNEDGPSIGSGTFAFYSNGNWIINNAGEATLQVIDLTGRILSSETVNGSVSKTINATPGVYMLRLINGENVNVQKIVVR